MADRLIAGAGLPLAPRFLPLLPLGGKKGASGRSVWESNGSHVQSDVWQQHSALQEMLEILLTATTWLKGSNISDKGGRRVGNVSHRWDFLSGRGETAAGDGNTKHYFTSFRWLIGLFRPRSSGSDVRTGCELLIKYMFCQNINSDLLPSFHGCVVMLVRQSCNNSANTTIWSTSNYVLPEKEKPCFEK